MQYVYVAGFVPVPVPQMQTATTATATIKASPPAALSPQIIPTSIIPTAPSPVLSNGTPTAGYKLNSKNTPSTSPAFVWDGWKYPAGLNRKERRAIMFPQEKRQMCTKKVLNRVWVGMNVTNGPIRGSGITSPTTPMSPLTLTGSLLSFSRRESEESLSPSTNSALTPASCYDDSDGSNRNFNSEDDVYNSARLDEALPPLMDEWSDDEL